MNSNARFDVIIPAGGTGSRMRGGPPKIFSPLKETTVIQRVVSIFSHISFIQNIIIPTRPEFIEHVKELCDFSPIPVKVVIGGERRQDSIAQGFKESHDAKYIIIHDAARPCVRPVDIEHVCQVAMDTGAAVLGVVPKSTIKIVDELMNVVKTLPRDTLSEIQTPQVFARDVYAHALEYVKQHHIDVTDDAQMVELAGNTVRIVQGQYSNIKITTQEDLNFVHMIEEDNR